MVLESESSPSPSPDSPSSTHTGSQAPLPPFPHPESTAGRGARGPQNYRQPASRHASHSLALRSVGGGVQAGAGHRRGGHSLRVQRGVVGGGDRAELGAAEAGRPQFGGAHGGQPLQGQRSGRGRGAGPSQHGQRGAPSPGALGACGGSPGPGHGAEARGSRQWTPAGQGRTLLSWPAAQRWEIPARRSPRGGDSGGRSARGCPAPRAAATRHGPTPRRASAPGVRLAPGRGLRRARGLHGEAMRSDGEGTDGTDSLSPRCAAPASFSATFFFFFFFLAPNCVPRNSDLPRKMPRFRWSLQQIQAPPSGKDRSLLGDCSRSCAA